MMTHEVNVRIYYFYRATGGCYFGLFLRFPANCLSWRASRLWSRWAAAHTHTHTLMLSREFQVTFLVILLLACGYMTLTWSTPDPRQTAVLRNG